MVDFKWHHEQEIIRSEVMIVKKRKKLICTPNICNKNYSIKFLNSSLARDTNVIFYDRWNTFYNRAVYTIVYYGNRDDGGATTCHQNGSGIWPGDEWNSPLKWKLA